MTDLLHERLAIEGACELGDGELLALALGTPLDRAGAALARLGPLPSLLHAELDELCSAAGLTPRRAAALRAAVELGRRAVDQPLRPGTRIRGAGDAVKHLRGRLSPLEVEEVHVLALDAHGRIKRHACVARGAPNQVMVSASDVFRPVIRAAAVAAIVAHNHPTGEPSPSQDDLALTRRLDQAARALGVSLLDHVIVARRGCFSFAGAGLLDRKQRACKVG